MRETKSTELFNGIFSMATEGVAGAIKEGISKALSDWVSEPIEQLTGLRLEKFSEHVAVEVTADLIVALLIGLAGFLISRRLWRAVQRRWRAATIRKVSDNAFVLVRCPIANDPDNTIGSEIDARLETAFRVFAGWPASSIRPFHIMQFPLPLPSGDSSRSHDRAVGTAKRWLERTAGDILIWGKRVRGDSVGVIRLIGTDLRTGIIETRRIDFDKRARDFDVALANAIAFEAARLTQVSLAEPELVSLDELRVLAERLKRLASADAPALSEGWRQQVMTEYWRISAEIVRQSPSSEERDNLEVEARIRLSAVNQLNHPIRFADAALSVATLLRKKNWSDPNRAQLSEARGLLDQAITIFEGAEALANAAEAAVERVQVKRQELTFVGSHEAEHDADYRRILGEAMRLVQAAGDEAQYQRLSAAAFSYPTSQELAELYSFDTDDPSSSVDFIERVARYLDNGELLDVAVLWVDRMQSIGDHKSDPRFYAATTSLLTTILASRVSWTKSETDFMKSKIGMAAGFAYQRVEQINSAQAMPYADLSNTMSADLNQSLGFTHTQGRTYVELWTLANSGLITGGEPRSYYERAIRALRICVGANAERFPRLQLYAKRSLIAVLNNHAAAFDSFDSAQEALNLALGKPIGNGKGIVEDFKYIIAYAAWQVARLTTTADLGVRTQRARQAHLLAQQALQQALEQDNKVMIAQTDRILKVLEHQFHDL